MPVNIVRFKTLDNPAPRWGVVDDGIFEIEGTYETTADFLEIGKGKAFALADTVRTERGTATHLDEAEILSPVTNPCQVLCQGANYRQHMIESGMNPDEKNFNMIFNKSAGCINEPSGNIVRPKHVKLLDYEVELGLVIGKAVKQPTEIKKTDLSTYVAGLVIGNDISARDVQVPQMQFFKGKSYRSFCPVGPYLCLLEDADIHYLDQLDLTLTVNGDVRQNDSTANLVFKPAETLSELSQIADLNVGDLVLTGTPAGCAMRIPSPLFVKLLGLLPERKKWGLFLKKQVERSEYLQPGDVIETRISSRDGVIDLGLQRNAIVAQ